MDLKHLVTIMHGGILDNIPFAVASLAIVRRFQL